MQNLPDDVKRTFCRLITENAHPEIIKLLVSLRAKVDLSIDDAGWALWNICDRYALMRDATNQHKYQLEFHEWSKTHLFPLRLHWVVSDGTQALTLIDGGFLEFWWNCYEFANAHAPLVPENRTVRFESHRANAGAYSRFREFARAETALNAMERLLAEDPKWCNREFAAATFKTLLIKSYTAKGLSDEAAATGESLQRELDDWLGRAGDAQSASECPLLGSWDNRNKKRPSTAVFVAINNAACALTQARQFPAGERLFQILLERNRTLNAYGEAQYLLSRWKNTRNKDEIIERLHSLMVSQKLTPKALQRFVPELVDVVKADRPNFA